MNSVKALAIVCVTACLTLASSALGVGADIQHSGLSTQPINTYGPVGGVYAYILGSNTCNMGDAPLAWINNGTPGLAMNAYRLHNGRFVQIGLGNAKTACCVANNTSPICAPLTCQAGPAGHLRAGCLDTYSAGFNAGQGRLAPRSFINPQSGAIDTTYVHNSGDVIYRRCQVKQVDMDPATFLGAQYFVEGHYACAEDAVANNDLNNASYSRVNVSPSFVFSPAGSFNVGTPAIYAWRDHGLGAGVPDRDVTIQAIDIPNEGRFYVGHKVSDNFDGTWRYEYVVSNFNSDRAAGSFVVPIPTGAVVTNAGFSSPDYHSGEIYDNTDWVMPDPLDSYQVRWSSPENFEDDPNTNALRWGTMYSFWFTCDRAPVAGHAELGLFKPAVGCQPTKASIALNVPAADCPADVSRNGAVDVDDLLGVISAWGPCECQYACGNDIVINNQVDVDDLLALIEAWGGCP